MCKDYGFKVGDTITDGFYTAVVSRIDPACNNVYVVAEQRNGIPKDSFAHERELLSPNRWSRVDVFGSLKRDMADLIIYSRQSHGEYAGNVALHKVIQAPGAGRAKFIVTKLAETLETGQYRALLRFWDEDVCEYDLTVEPPEPAVNTVKYA